MTVTVADRAWAYIPRDRRRALAAGVDLPTRANGAALFVDISGFTPLTEGLADELGSHRASELLTANLNRVFRLLIDELHARGGDVIYFSGDAITCWLVGDDGLRAVAAALAMQDAIARDGVVVTPAGKRFQLQLKAAVTVGAARRAVVGDPDIQLIDVLAGSIVDSLAEVEHACERGEVVVGPAAATALLGRVELGEARRLSDGVAAAVSALAVDVPFVPPFADDALSEELSRPWLLPQVHARLSTGRGEFLSELRPAFPVFVNFGGIDYDEDENAIAKLDEFVRGAQRVFTAYGGNVVTITIGDKGAYLFGVFGSPVAHEDDGPRACSAALDLVQLEETTSARNICVGISYGRLLTGTYGHPARRAFGSLGDDVNLSARLMTTAPPGEIYVSELVNRLAGPGFTWRELEPLTLKGKARPERAFALTGTKALRSRRSVRYTLPIVGRSGELAQLDQALADAGAGRGRVVGISAEAGMGKSRLVAEFLRGVGAKGAFSAVGDCQSFGTTASYAVWEPIWRRLLNVPETLSEAEQVEALERALEEQVDAALVPRAPLLGEVLDISIADTELTASLDPKLRKTSLESLLADCLLALAKSNTLVLVLEDCHWLDPLSRDLLKVLARVIRNSYVLIVCAYRPDAAASDGLDLAQLPGIEELELDSLADAAMTQVVETKVEQLFGDRAEAPDLLLELVVSRTQGNPFYAEEILNFVHERGVALDDERAVRALELPGSLHSLVLSRIDTLAEEPRRTLKVASVGGRTFRAPVLPGVYPELGSLVGVRSRVAALRTHDLVNADREEDESYLFKHAITQEVAYESIPFALRADLHGRYGHYLE
ncbi:MAG TPA: AAA family ATPase, partial [Gaiellaceae bacterium]|nr:AAA family ATPase [Gaiellaceae bacterium]